ncbi:MAG: exonuclease SbcCD subunit D [Clostridia bacterium]|nr:exonuclease SbcCD subunit D [Clostridia bacterium]
MKLMHLSDLHLGKRVNDFSMLEDQKAILEEILVIADREKPQGVILAGDVYDKSVPSSEAVTLLDDFLYALSERHLQVFLIAGNHDSPERLAFGGRLMEKGGIHIAPVYAGETRALEMQDEYGTVRVYLLPFLRPSQARRFFGDGIEDYTQAMRCAIEAMGVDTGVRNVLVTHQFVTGAQTCESEEIHVGGTENVDASVFAPFDYVALGHIHGPQKVGVEHIRYCGSPLKYSFSEKDHQKSVTMVELGEKGQVSVRTCLLKPLRDLREVRGTYSEVALRRGREEEKRDDYVHVILTDEEDVPDALAKLRTIYPNLMKLSYDNLRTRTDPMLKMEQEMEKLSETELFDRFYAEMNGRGMDDRMKAYVKGLFHSLGGDLA